MKKKIIFTILSLLIPFLLYQTYVKALTIAYPIDGGTGTYTVPTTGQVLVGQPDGTYLPVATSSLGLSPAGSTGQIQFNDNGAFGATSTFVISTSTGNVGVGTTTPSMKLEVIGASSLPATSGTTQTGIARFSNTTSPTLLSVVDIGSYNSTGAGWIQATNKNNLALNYALLLNPNGGNVGIGSTSPSAKLSVTGSGLTTGKAFSITDSAFAEKFTVLDNGNVGIGTTSPASLLHISSALPTFTLESTNTGLGAGNNYGIIDFKTNDGSANGVGTMARISAYTVGGSGNFGNLKFYTASNATTLTEKMVIDNAGNVGIGTTTPVANLDIYKSTGATLGLTGSGNNRAQTVFTNGNTSYAIGLDTSNVFRINNGTFTGQSTHFTINSSGNVGIGSTTPSAKLSIKGVGLTTGKALEITDSANSPKFTVLDNGNTTVNGDASYALTVNGGAKIANVYVGWGTTAGTAVLGGGSDGSALSFDGNNILLKAYNPGNVGIGTTTPASNLQVSGATAGYAGETGNLMISNSVDSTKKLYMGIDTTLGTYGSGYIQYMKSGQAYLPLLLNPNGGNIGIGTSSPIGKFTIATSTIPAFNIDSDGILNTKYGIYCELFDNDNTTAQSIPTGATYTKSTALASSTLNESKYCDADPTTQQFNITKPGKYRASGTFSFQSGTANVKFVGALFVGGVEQHNVHWHRKAINAGDESEASFTGYFTATSSSVVDLRVRHDNGGNVDFTIEYGNLNVEYISN